MHLVTLAKLLDSESVYQFKYIHAAGDETMLKAVQGVFYLELFPSPTGYTQLTAFVPGM